MLQDTDPRVFSRNGDMVTTYHWDGESNNRYVLNTRQDVEPYLERNKALANSGWDGYTADREMRHIGSIPNVIIMEWRTKYGIDVFKPEHADRVKRLLSDPDYMWLNPRRHRLRG